MEVEYQEEYIRNSRGVQLFTCRWLPTSSSSPKALVFLCHGYGMECSGFMRGCGTRLASAGYGVVGMDYEGHGRSMGARCYIKKFDDIVSDCNNFFKSVCEEEEHRGKRRFLYGESMGGAVALLLHKKDPTFWHGAVLVAPMCKIRNNRLIYQDKPRLKTALEMLRTSMSLEDSLNQVTIPFFLLHGEADTVTDPGVSRALYEQAVSKDKTMKLYAGMWHGLTSGEPDHNIEIVFADIIAWLDKRTDISDENAISMADQHLILRSDPPPLEQLGRLTPLTSSMEKDREQRRRRNKQSTRHLGNYLCGWKGRRMHHHHHHSAM
ncbi:caffeoylshikimate esterase-like isoform X3 [Telopea speciosissima]|uniref:caffeoylshikimate esterase-like isoform X3 n=1 Tax=Telopea speciosissima TaxID=54955 RepID=UPI001CC4571C|nr:caffeoylshikimate esterase-like isoform X3 [Telopea speciosissima]